MQKPHHVVRRELNQYSRYLGMKLSAEFGLETLHRRYQALLLRVQLLFIDDAIGHCLGERFQLLDTLMERRVFRAFVEPARIRHGLLLSRRLSRGPSTSASA